MNYYFTVVGKFACLSDLYSCVGRRFDLSCWEYPCQKRFADRDQTKCKYIYTKRQLQTWTDCAQKLWQTSSLGKGNLIYKNPLAVRLHCKFMTCHLERIFMLPRGSRRLKRSTFKYLAEVSVRKVLF